MKTLHWGDCQKQVRELQEEKKRYMAMAAQAQETDNTEYFRMWQKEKHSSFTLNIALEQLKKEKSALEEELSRSRYKVTPVLHHKKEKQCSDGLPVVKKKGRPFKKK